MCGANSTTNSRRGARATDNRTGLEYLSFAATFDATSTAKTLDGVLATSHSSMPPEEKSSTGGLFLWSTWDKSGADGANKGSLGLTTSKQQWLRLVSFSEQLALIGQYQFCYHVCGEVNTQLLARKSPPME
jgi:hypothetical protein